MPLRVSYKAVGDVWREKGQASAMAYLDKVLIF